MTKKQSAAIFVVMVLGVVALLYGVWQLLPLKKISPINQAPPANIVTNTAPVNVPEVKPEPVVTKPVTETPSTVARPQPANSLCDTTNSICVDVTLQNSLLTNPIIVAGTAIAFENQFSWRLVYVANGVEQTYAEGTVMANAPDAGQPGPFEIRAFLPLLKILPPAVGTLQLFEASAKDGSPIHIVKIPVKLPTTVQTATIYYSNQYAARQGDCTQATPVKVQMLRSITPIEATLRRLLEEGSNSEIANEFIDTQIPDGTTLKSLVLAKDGTVTVIFSPGLDVGGGSCHVSAIRAQIEATLKQFPSVKKVVITVDGKTPETTLQP